MSKNQIQSTSEYTHLDLLHQELDLGAIVCYIVPGMRRLGYGVVSKITRTGVSIENINNRGNTVHRTPETLIKINDQLSVAKNLNPELFI